MPIQVLGLRPYNDPKTGKEKFTTKFFTEGWRFSCIEEVFDAEKRQELLAKIPETDRYNLYFTAAECFEAKKPRVFHKSHCIQFDIDNIELVGEEDALERAAFVAKQAALSLGINYEELGVIFSGHGVQIFVLLDRPIQSKEYYDSTRDHYHFLASKIQDHLDKNNIKGHVDSSVWDAARIMRLPDTENVKKGKPVRFARVVNASIKPQSIDIISLCGPDFKIQTKEVIKDAFLKDYPLPDSEAVLSGCDFIKFCREKPNEVREPQWYAMLGITARLENGHAISHEYSKGHKDYDSASTDSKIEQALESSGPRTCKNIATMWDGCRSCPHWEAVVSPIRITGPNFVATRTTGFRNFIITKDGQKKRGELEYEDLIKQFGLEYTYKNVEISAHSFLTYIYNGKFWEEFTTAQLQLWFRSKVDKVKMYEFKEFCGQFKPFHSVGLEWFLERSMGMINMGNGVVTVRDGKFTAHSPEYGFRSIMPYNYDPHATSPKWDKFMDELCSGSQEKISLIEEYISYAIAGDRCWLGKALFLMGPGGNGKSTLLRILYKIVGKTNYITPSFSDLKEETTRLGLNKVLFAACEELSSRDLRDSTLFKSIVTGDSLKGRKLYESEIYFENRAKLFFAGNEFPYSEDKTDAVYRRFIIVNLTNRFDNTDNNDPYIDDKIGEEAPGILNKLMERYRELVKRGKLKETEYLNREIEEVRESEDVVKRFMEDRLIVEDMNTSKINTKVKDIYSEFCAYSEAEGSRNPLHLNTFYKRLSVYIKDLDKRRNRFGHSRDRYYKGIELIED